MTPLKALLVDVGGTLVDDRTWIERREYERKVVAQLRVLLGGDEPWFPDLASHLFPDSDAPTWKQDTVSAVLGFLADRGISTDKATVKRICRTFALPIGELVSLAEGAAEAVAAIHSLGIPMVICTNTLWRNDADVRRDWQLLGFKELFAAYVTSHDTGYAKPHPAMFWRCLSKVGVDPAEAAIIGDLPERDIAGAKSVGMRAIWMRPANHRRPPVPQPDAEVRRWAEVPPLIEAWRRGDASSPTAARDK